MSSADDSPRPARSLSRLGLQRLLFRCSADFVLDEFGRMETAFGGSLTRGLVALSVRQAWRRTPDNRAGASAIARSLGLPVETVRRHLIELQSGRFPHADLTPGDRATAEMSARALASRDELVATILRLQRLGYPPLSDVPVEAILAQPPHLLAVELDDLVLRAAEAAIAAHGSIQDAQVFVALILLNADALSDDTELAWEYATTETPPPDSMLRPVAAAELARRLDKPLTTMQRRLERLVSLGRARRERDGYLSDRAFQEVGPVRAAGWRLNQDFERLIFQAVAFGQGIDSTSQTTR